MKIHLQLKVEGRVRMNDSKRSDETVLLNKEYESPIIPRIDDYIFVGGMKKEEAKVKHVLINYDANTCHVSIETIVGLNELELEVDSLLENSWNK